MTEARQGVDMGRLGRLAVLAFCGLAVLLLSAAETEAQSPIPGVSLTCLQSAITLDVSPGASGEGSTICQVENTAIYEETIELDIIGTGDVDASISDQILVISGGGMEEVTITFEAPIRSPAEDSSWTLNATVTKVQLIPLNEQLQQKSELNLLVSIEQYLLLELSAPGFTIKVEPGEDFNITAKLRNTGNVKADVDFRISNGGELVAAGISCISVPAINGMAINAYADMVVIFCTVDSDIDESDEVVIKMHARAKGGGDEYLSEDVSVRISIEVEDEGGLGGLGSLTKDISKEDMQLLMYVGGGLLALLVILFVTVKISREKGAGGYEVWDDEEFDFEL